MRATRALALVLLLAFGATSAPSAPTVPAADEPAGAARAGDEGLLVFAAASLTDALGEITARFTERTGQRIKVSLAASSTLARQIEAGARADVFVSADAEWMDYLDERGLIDRATRRDIAGNRLALVAPADSKVQLTIGASFPLAAALGSSRLATGDPASVPVGRYARAALTSLGVWDEVADRVARAENVRSALALVARGEAVLGIVYETDALIEKRVRVVGLFPESAHARIVYPAAVTAQAGPGAREFAEFLSEPAAQAVFRRYGFQPAAR